MPTLESPLDLWGCTPPDLARPDAVQAGVHVLLLDPLSLRPVAVSEGCRRLTDRRSLKRCFRYPLGGFWSDGSARQMTHLLQQDPSDPLGLMVTSDGGESFWISRFTSEGRIGLLVEPLPARTAAANDLADVDPSLRVLMTGLGDFNDTLEESSEPAVLAFAQRMATLMREAIDFQRVMVYRFDPDWNGTVIAEARAGDVTESYFGLTFPASDIPQQARQLFQSASVRPTIDVLADPQRLIYAPGETPGADLSACRYRAVADVHREYLNNMGVRASLTLALTVNGRLWGLVACHHFRGPVHVDPLKLVMFRSLSEIFSLALSRLVQADEHRLMKRIGRLGQWLQQRVALSHSLDFQNDVMPALRTRLVRLLGCQSFAYSDASELYRSPGAPSAEAIKVIAGFFRRWSREHGRPVLMTSNIQGYGLQLSAADARKAAGVVALGGSGNQPLLLLFRSPSTQPTTWAGDPDHRVERAPGSDRLDPRSSFEVFVQEHRGDSDPWPTYISRVALELRDALKQAHWIHRSRLDARELERSHHHLVQAKEEMRHAAMHDALTGLANRRSLKEYFRDAIPNRSDQASPLAFLHLDLDGFKLVNDTFGHDIGDQLLVEVSEILREVVRQSDLIVRLGGDEFAILTCHAEDRAALEGLARRLITRLARPHLISEKVCRIGVSIGITLGRPDDQEASNLLRQSDVALYESKRRGKGCFTFYTDELDAAIREELKLSEELVKALQNNELEVYYQPQFSVSTHQLVGVEALLRWNHPTRGVLVPPSFLPIAQKAGLLGAVDAHALELIDQCYQNWLELGIHVPKVSINVSADQLCSPGFAQRVLELRMPPEVITLELLESIYLDEPNPSVLAALQTLQQVGIRVELDDFGSGRTSVLSLMAVEPDGLKVDKHLVIPALNSKETARLLRLVVSMGHALEIGVTAEGVESDPHMDLVANLGCDVMQGYGLARPMREPSIVQLMRRDQFEFPVSCVCGGSGTTP